MEKARWLIVLLGAPLLLGADGKGCITIRIDRDDPPPRCGRDCEEPEVTCQIDDMVLREGQTIPGPGGCGSCTCTREGVVCLAIACPDECQSNDDCAADESCVAGDCVADACWGAFRDQSGLCRDPADGVYDDSCCEPLSCADDRDCKEGTHCEGSSVCPEDVVCVWEGEPGICVPDVACFSSQDCGESQYCSVEDGDCKSPCDDDADMCETVCVGVCLPLSTL